MKVTTSKETLNINQVIGQKTDAFIIEEDFVVPDIKPDILNIVDATGIICIYKKEVVDGKVKIDGSVNAYVMYLADDEKSSIRSMNTVLNFSQTIEFNDNVKAGMFLESNINLKTVECKVLNGRKVNIRAIIDLNLKVLSNEEIEFVKGIDDIKDIQLQNTSLNLDSLIGNEFTKIYAKDTIVIDSADNLLEIMKSDISIINKETKISYNKILVKADACIKIMYLTEDNRICTTKSLIPIMGFIDVPDIKDEDLCDIRFEVKNIVIKPNSIEEHSIYVEIELDVMASVSKNKQMNIIQDLYSPTENLIYKQKKIKAISKKNIIKDICSVRNNQYIEEIGNKKIYDIDVYTNILNRNMLNGKIVYEGEITLKILYDSDSISKFVSKSITIPFTHDINCEEIDNTSDVETDIQIKTQDFTVLSDTSIDISVDMEFIVNIVNNRSIQVIEEVDIDEKRNTDNSSLTIYFIKQGDTLWNIAKRFKSTIDAIVQINDIEDENKLSIGQQLFIPNYYNY